MAATPHEPRLFAVGGNDHCVRLWDVRKLPAPGDGAGGGSGAASSSAKADNRALSLALATLPHPRVVSDIAFSPLTGRRLMTTCPDNRVRVWDRVSALGGAEVAPSREVIHSQASRRAGVARLLLAGAGGSCRWS